MVTVAFDSCVSLDTCGLEYRLKRTEALLNERVKTV
jgi:hypothetical protein